MSAGRVFVVGSLNADHRVQVARIPKPGETMLASDIIVSAGGKGANQAVAAARAGAATTIIGAIGDDGDGAVVSQALQRQDIDTGHVRVIPDAPTGRALITVDARGENTIVVSPGANDKLAVDDIDAGLRGIGDGDLLLLQLETPELLVRHAARVASAAGAGVLLNPTPVPESVCGLFDDVDLLIVNEHELAQLGDDIAGLARQAEATVICTAGAEGASVTHRGRVEHVAAADVHAVDTTAAGDTFIGYVAAHLAARRDDIIGAIETAVQAAGLAVTRAGAIDSIPYRNELPEGTR
ncbi:ribokinase [Mycolicibacterium agri]|uniref:Ribokinase n=1 Tax=Mycolicibacterium agri TaxID=36811 RepID=A0A2A7N5B3_MYCAG|nr:ribokinase [Mycolicibacterium agri]PEG38917.1 ribokinase [Mycolicibacterium agri]GFG53207.1 ribokinase [Mycolicibacterium agri]